MSHCQGVSQVQQASQVSLTVQTLGSAGQQAIELGAPSGPAPTSQVTSTITQIQLGCLSSCFGTTTTDAATATLTQQVLAELSSLLPPPDGSGLQPTPGTEQNVVDQIACQLEQGQGSMGAQTQVASQSVTAIQLLDAGPSSPAPVPPTVSQAEQQTWQLQIGCLFYCVDSQQIQQAQQSITTIDVLIEPLGATGASGTDPVNVADQGIWQLQIGCVAWCYNATQLQEATSQTTITVVTSLPPADPIPPSPATPAPPDPGNTSEGPHAPAATEVVAPLTSTSTSPPPPNDPSLLRGATWTGSSILVGRSIAVAVAAPAPAFTTTRLSLRTAPAEIVGRPPFASSTQVTPAGIAHVTPANVRQVSLPRTHRAESRAVATTPAAIKTTEALVEDASSVSDLAAAALLFALVGGFAAIATYRRRSTRDAAH